MVDLYTGTVPNLTQSQPEFDTNTQTILDYIAGLAPQLNEWVGAYVQDTTSASTTSNTIGTGSKTFTVEAGKGYKVNMTLRASATSGNFMDGIVTGYSGTSLTVNFTTFTGSGTFTSWQIFLSIPGSSVTLGSNTFTGDQFVPDEAYDASGWNGDLSVPTKNAVRDKIESVLSGLFTLETESSDPTGASVSSTKAASPSWITLGFAITLGTTGRILLPKWLGSFEVKWGSFSVGGSGTTGINFASAFGTACYHVQVGITYAGSGTPGSVTAASGSITSSGFNLGSSGALSGNYIAFGKG